MTLLWSCVVLLRAVGFGEGRQTLCVQPFTHAEMTLLLTSCWLPFPSRHQLASYPSEAAATYVYISRTPKHSCECFTDALLPYRTAAEAAATTDDLGNGEEWPTTTAVDDLGNGEEWPKTSRCVAAFDSCSGMLEAKESSFAVWLPTSPLTPLLQYAPSPSSQHNHEWSAN